MDDHVAGICIGAILMAVAWLVVDHASCPSNDCARKFGTRTHEFSDCVYQQTYGDKQP